MALRNRARYRPAPALLRRGAAFGGPATTTGFNSAMPANLPSLSERRAPEKPSAGAGDSAKSLPLPTCGTEP
jgi:hypothetical protein